MAQEVRWRRGTAAEHESWVGAQSEITHDTTNNNLRVHDGSTPGGFRTVMEHDLGATSNGGFAAKIGRNVIAVDSIADLLALPESERREDLRYLVKGYHAGTDIGGGIFRYDAARAGENDNGTVIFGFIRIDADVLTPEMFGAKGDGVTNDTDAFQYLAAAINARGGGAIEFPRPVTYMVGRQIFAGATGKGYAYRGENILVIQDCDRPVTLKSNGAKIKYVSGLKFGAFDPVTGEKYPSSVPFTNSNYVASIGTCIRFTRNAEVTVTGRLELDGSNEDAVIGGPWGDAGRQIAAYGLQLEENKSAYIEGVYTHHHCLDGLAIRSIGTDADSPTTPVTLVNVTSEYNARQACSWTSGNGLVAINCKFNRTGRAYNTDLGNYLDTSPSSGLDIEASSGWKIRNGVFIGCEFVNNSAVAMVADSGNSADVKFYKCLFAGTVWPNKPGFVFEDCKFFGLVLNQYASPDPKSATRFVGCEFRSEDYDDFVYSAGNQQFQSSRSSRVFYDRCSFYAIKGPVGRLDRAVLRGCYIFVGYQDAISQDWVANLQFAYVHDLTVETDFEVQSTTANGAFYFINASMRTAGRLHIENKSSGKVFWNSWSPGAGGYAGFYGVSRVDRYGDTSLILNKNGRSDNWAGTIRITAGTGSPSGTETPRERGDIIINQNASLGGILGWVCIEAGSPGTWVPIGQVGVKTSISAAPAFVGEMAVVGGVGYIAVGTSSAGDWKQITNA